jgi:hypothetical protein
MYPHGVPICVFQAKKTFVAELQEFTLRLKKNLLTRAEQKTAKIRTGFTYRQ